MNVRYSVDLHTRLLTACCTDDKESVLDCLYLGADVNFANQDGISGLMWAAKEGSTHVLAVLLAQPQLRVNAVDGDGDTALAHAASNGQTQVRLAAKIIAYSLGIILSFHLKTRS